MVRVLPIENDKWEVIVKDLPNDRFTTQIYDAIFVCNGHFSEPLFPVIEDANGFKGRLMHSHDFRTADGFQGKGNSI